MARIEIHDLGKRYPASKDRGCWALRHATLTAAQGDLLVLVGPSGAGKTTLLRLLAGLEEPTEGTITLDGRPMNGVPPGDRDIAMVFQNSALYPHLTVSENIGLGLRLRKVPKAQIEPRVRDAAALLGLEGCLDRRPAALSGGERQRVAIGRALVRQPAVFLFDEPLSNLDTPRRLQMREEILRLHDRLGATMVYVTHDQGDAQAMGNRLVVLNQGVIQQTAAPLALYHQPANLFVAGFIGSPPMNVFRGTISAKEGSLWLRSEAAAKDGTPAIFLQVPQELTKPLERFAGKAVFCGIRAEQVECVPKTVPAGQGGMGIVERTEPAGADTCLRLRLGEKGRDQIMARVPVNSRWEREEAVFFRFDPRQACFFDPATGDNLLPPE